jgi:hypothetical protein
MVIFISLNYVDDLGWYLRHASDIGLGYQNIFTSCISIIPQLFLHYPQASIAPMHSP